MTLTITRTHLKISSSSFLPSVSLEWILGGQWPLIMELVEEDEGEISNTILLKVLQIGE